MKSIVLLLLFSGVAFGDEPKTQALKLNGVDGVWMPLPSAKKALECVERAPNCDLLVRKIFLLEDLVAVRVKEADLAKQKAELEKSISDALRKQVEDITKQRDQVLLEAGRWYRNPWLYGTAGFVLGGAAIFAAIR